MSSECIRDVPRTNEWHLEVAGQALALATLTVDTPYIGLHSSANMFHLPVFTPGELKKDRNSLWPPEILSNPSCSLYECRLQITFGHWHQMGDSIS